MKRFEQLHADDQVQILLATLEQITAESHTCIEELAEARGTTILKVWQQICAEAGLDECTPWEGFPEIPKNLPEAPGDSRELPEIAQRLFAKIFPPKIN